MITNKEKQHMKEVLEEFSKKVKKLNSWFGGDYMCINKKDFDKLVEKTISKHCGKPLEDEI